MGGPAIAVCPIHLVVALRWSIDSASIGTDPFPAVVTEVLVLVAFPGHHPAVPTIRPVPPAEDLARHRGHAAVIRPYRNLGGRLICRHAGIARQLLGRLGPPAQLSIGVPAPAYQLPVHPDGAGVRGPRGYRHRLETDRKLDENRLTVRTGSTCALCPA